MKIALRAFVPNRIYESSNEEFIWRRRKWRTLHFVTGHDLIENIWKVWML